MKGVSIALAGVMALGACTGEATEPDTPKSATPAPGSYEFSDIVVRDSNVPTIPNAKAVKFQARWLGTGPPEMVDCIFTIRDESGTTVTKRTTYYSAEPTLEQRAEVILSDPAINGRPSASLDATVECHPLSTA